MPILVLSLNAKYEKKPIVTEPDTLLFYDITTDPNDVVCNIDSAITDIRNRYRVQINLWENVLNLRNGKYYDSTSINEFLTLLNACRNNLYDNADLAYNNDEIAIMRRFLSVFSLRPVIMSTKPIHTIASVAAGPLSLSYGMPSSGMDQGVMQSAFPFVNQPVYTITSVPMITLQIPPNTGNNNEAEPKDLRSAINQTIWINEHKTIVPKEQQIIYSKRSSYIFSQ